MVKLIMVQGTCSNAGKSLLCAALCRIFRQDGYRVAPFKSQNMALNSFITADGREMGRAQVVQAEAAGIAPDVRMNPILLKPTSDVGSQVIIMGEAHGNRTAREYWGHKKALLPERLRLFLIHDFKHLRRRYNKRFFREVLFVTSDQIRVFISLRHGDFIKHQILGINQLLSSNQSLHRNSVGDDCLKHGRDQCFRKMKLGPAQHLCIFAHDFLIIQRNDVSAEKALYNLKRRGVFVASQECRYQNIGVDHCVVHHSLCLASCARLLNLCVDVIQRHILQTIFVRFFPQGEKSV